MSEKILLTYDAFARCMELLSVRNERNEIFCIPSFYIAMYLNQLEEQPAFQELIISMIKQNFVIIETVPMAGLDYAVNSGSILEIAENQDFTIGCREDSKLYPLRLYTNFVNAVNVI